MIQIDSCISVSRKQTMHRQLMSNMEDSLNSIWSKFSTSIYKQVVHNNYSIESDLQTLLRFCFKILFSKNSLSWALPTPVSAKHHYRLLNHWSHYWQKPLKALQSLSSLLIRRLQQTQQQQKTKERVKVKKKMDWQRLLLSSNNQNRYKLEAGKKQSIK